MINGLDIKAFYKTINQSGYGRFILFILKFCLVYFSLHFFFQLLIGGSVKGGFYLSILEDMDLAKMYRDFQLYVTGVIMNLFGYEYGIDGNRIYIIGGVGALLGYSCYGFNEISFYSALIISYPKGVNIKYKMLIFGVLFIVISNILRIVFVTIVFNEFPRETLSNLDHHLIYNVWIYSCILAGFLFFVTRK